MRHYASVSSTVLDISALEALRNALYKCPTYLLTYLLDASFKTTLVGLYLDLKIFCA